MAETILEMIRDRAVAFPDRPALGVCGKTDHSFLTYRELWRLVDLIAAGLINRRIQPGDRFALLLDDRAIWGLFYLGILRAGATVVPLDNLQKPYEWASILTESAAAGAFISSAYSDDLREECGRIPAVQNWLAIEPNSSSMLADRVSGHIMGESAAQWPAITGGMLAALVFTSGTTSVPKGVMLTHRNLASDVEAIHRLKLFDPEDRFLSVLPIHHTFECTAGLLNPLCLGSSVAYARSLRSRDILEDLKSSQATVILAVPLLFEKITNTIKRGITKQPPVRRRMFDLLYTFSRLSKQRLGVNLGKPLFRSLRRQGGLDHLRLVVSGGAALPPEVSEFMDTIGVPLMQGYGMTEASPVLSVNPPVGYKYDSVGPPLPGVEMKIIAPDASGVGEIAARGEMITPGYWHRPDQTKKLFRDGWLLTGDLGWADDDGHFHITGRAKNVIVTPAGKNVYPEEIEMLIAESPLILEALVFAQRGPGGTREKIACAVVPDLEYINVEHGELPRAEVEKLVIAETQKICNRLADYKKPTEIIVREAEFEKTSTKKIKRFLFARTKEELFPIDPEL